MSSVHPWPSLSAGCSKDRVTSVCGHGRAPVPVGHREGHLQALPGVCAWVCRVLGRAELGKTLLGMDVGNYSAVPKAQELRASSRTELVWSEALAAQGFAWLAGLWCSQWCHCGLRASSSCSHLPAGSHPEQDLWWKGMLCWTQSKLG